MHMNTEGTLRHLEHIYTQYPKEYILLIYREPLAAF